MDHSAVSWPGPLVWYAFLSGVAAGSSLLASLTALFGSEADRRATRRGFLLAFPLLIICLVLLAIQSARNRTASVWFSLGFLDVKSWETLCAVSVASLLGRFVEEESFRPSRPLSALKILNRRGFGFLLAAVGMVAALGLAVSLGPASKPDWASLGWLGAVQLTSATCMGFATASLTAPRASAHEEIDTDARLATGSAMAIVLELVSLTGLSLSMRGLSGFALQRWPGSLIPLFVVPFGLVLPLVLRQVRGPRGAIDAAWLVLLGGFILHAALAGIPASLALK